MLNWRGIVIHCSDSEFGDAEMIDRWHKERGWSGIGYHFVITRSGTVQLGRTLHRSGAHAKGYNTSHIGICLIGVKQFNHVQFKALDDIVKALMGAFDIKLHNIIGHYQCRGTNKTCPNFDVDKYKEKLGDVKWVLDI